MQQLKQELAEVLGLNPWLETAFWLTVLIIAAALVNFIVKLLLVRGLNRLISGISIFEGDEFTRSGIIPRLANAAPALVISRWIGDVPGLPAGVAQVVQNVAEAFNILVVAMAISAIFGLAEKIWRRRNGGTGRSVKGYVQVATILVYGLASILMIAAIIDRSPMILLSGLGALTAVLLLVFQDTLLSLVASVQISSTEIVRVGDWIEMPSMNADGEVMDMSLYSVTVRNWDNTFTTFPVRKLVSDPFKNWRGMTQSGGRRIKRAIFIDQSSIRFLSREEYDRLAKMRRLTDYLDRKTREISEWNNQLGPARDVPANTRRMTNVGAFRAYIEHYLRGQPGVHQGMTLLVRQLPPTAEGLPIEIYCFTATTAWGEYESIQSDIFDHLIAILPEFGLSVFQSPSGQDFLRLADLGRARPPRKSETA